MTNGTGNDEKFKLVAMTRTNLTQVHADEVRLRNGELLNAAKELDGREETNDVLAELLGVPSEEIKEQRIDEGDMVTFVGAFSDLSEDPNTGNSFITTKTVTLVTKKE